MKKSLYVILFITFSVCVFSQNLGLEFGIDYGCGFEIGSGSANLESSKELDIFADANLNLCGFFNNFGLGTAIGVGYGMVGLNYKVMGYGIGYTAFAPKLNCQYFVELKISENDRLCVSPLDMSFYSVKNGKDFNDKEIEINRIVSIIRFNLKYSHFSQSVNNTKKGFYIGIGYAYGCSSGEKGGEAKFFENNNPLQITFGGKVIYKAI